MNRPCLLYIKVSPDALSEAWDLWLNKAQFPFTNNCKFPTTWQVSYLLYFLLYLLFVPEPPTPSLSQAVPQGSMAGTALTCVAVRMAPTVTTSLASVPVERASSGPVVSRVSTTWIKVQCVLYCYIICTGRYTRATLVLVWLSSDNTSVCLTAKIPKYIKKR